MSQIIDNKTGSFRFSEDFVVSAGTTEQELCKQFGAKITPTDSFDLSFVSAPHIVIGKFYFMFTFTCSKGKLASISFKVSDSPFAKNYVAPESDWGYSEEEIKLFDYHEKWLQQQLGSATEFGWGEINAIWQPLAGGAIIYLVYN